MDDTHTTHSGVNNNTLFGRYYKIIGQVDGLDISYGIFNEDNPIYVVKNIDDISIYPTEETARVAYQNLLRKILRHINNNDEESPW